MKVGIIGAMEEEIRTIKKELSNVVETTIAHATFFAGQYQQHQVVLVQSGIGKVNAALTTTLMIDHFDVDYLINTGSAGGIGEGLHIGDVVIANRLSYHDVDVTAFDYEKGQMAGMPLYYEADDMLVKKANEAATATGLTTHTGLIVSGDQFIHDQGQIDRIHQWFPEVLANEMEGTAIAQVAHQFNTPFVVIRAMSDVGDSDASVNFDDFILQAGAKSAEMTLSLIAHL